MCARVFVHSLQGVQSGTQQRGPSQPINFNSRIHVSFKCPDWCLRQANTAVKRSKALQHACQKLLLLSTGACSILQKWLLLQAAPPFLRRAVLEHLLLSNSMSQSGFILLLAGRLPGNGSLLMVLLVVLMIKRAWSLSIFRAEYTSWNSEL